MARCQLPYHKAMEAARDPNRLVGFLELHIEQGPVLEKSGHTIGVVEGISGVFKWLIRFKGKAGHAGTAPMDLRSDAFMGVADFAHELTRIIDEEGSEKSRLTIGRVELKPGYAHTVPGQAEFTLVGRDISEPVMDFSTLVMPSGAGHDAQFFTDITPTGLLFIPSVGGISHAPDEWSHWHDVEKGCNVLLNSVLELVAAD